MAEAQCRVVQQDQHVALHAPTFTYHLDLAAGLRGIAWTNQLTDMTIELGLEFEADLDCAEQRSSQPNCDVAERRS